jgi:uncharacterized protein CbrC (UPF0167 family)
MKEFKAPQFEVIHFGNKDLMTSSIDCDCVECLPCEHGNDCRYVDTCPTYCVRDGI